ncbi:FKBP-type peptidyl-prolyl cis-trans isomerase [Luteolibacter marinus]|uniref:FKBP-type peptidyl-prolyl cis-trans isomerase n=1 Tax=Luteolibacter marinus TaxID=2776705 RepID=UPI001865B636|nr:FKBP-type peptidyl-prolyl cis-trans isomerase [Luteolibacter marinus]
MSNRVRRAFGLLVPLTAWVLGTGISVHAADPEDKSPEVVSGAPVEASVKDSGLGIQVLRKGSGTRKPGNNDRVELHFSSWTKDGKLYDSSLIRNQPVTLLVGEVIPGWSEALKDMVEGEKRALWVPADLAYGEAGGGGKPGGQMYFELELIRVLPGPKLPVLPEDQRSVPGEAHQGQLGLSWVRIAGGRGKGTSGSMARVALHYDIWDAQGRLIDTSALRGEAILFDFNDLDPTWKLMVADMAAGEKRRVWCNASAAMPDAKPPLPKSPWIADLTLERVELAPE